MGKPVGKFSLEFGTPGKQIDAACYGLVLVNTVVVLEEFANELETGAKIRIRVRAEKRGSYLTEFSFEAAALIGTMSQMITPENIHFAKEFAKKVIDGVGKCFEFAKKLNGETPKEVKQLGDGNVQVNGDNHGPITVNNHIYNVTINNDRASEAISKTFGAISEDEEVNAVKLLDDKKKPVFEAKRSDFPALAKRIKPSLPKTKTRRVKAVLSIVRQSFMKEKKSDFLYAGNSISAFIEDLGFWNRVDNGERFAKGDKLVTRLEVSQEYNESVKTYENRGYKIVEVVEHRPQVHQTGLFENEDSKSGREKKVIRR